MENVPTDDYLYIDGDILPYRVGFVTQTDVYRCDLVGEQSCSPILVTTEKRKVTALIKKYGNNLEVYTHRVVEDEVQAEMTLKLMIQQIVAGSGCKLFKVVLSGDTNFREKIATIQKYKGNRDGTDKPHHWAMLREWLLAKPYTIVTEDEEADDELSRQCLRGKMIATIDKDLNNTPGWHYNFVKKEIYYVTEEEATRNFYTQALVGDTADNIPGLKGIGPAKAAKILGDATDAETMERRVLKAYEAYYDHPMSALLEVGQLLWMRREEGEMWYPVTFEEDY